MAWVENPVYLLETGLPSQNRLHMNPRVFLWPLGAASLFLAACGSGSDAVSGGDIVGLSMPDGMNLVEVESGSANSSVTAGATISPAVTFGANTDYHQDEVSAHMWDVTTQPLNTINDILKSVAQTRADEFVNDGAYLALVEMVGDEDGGQADTGQSSSGQATELEPWIVNSTRASSTAPHITRVWIEQEEDFGPSGGGSITNTIHARAVVTAAPTTSNPNGQFKLDFGMINQDDDSLMFRGTLATTPASTGKLGFTFFEEDVAGLFGENTRVAVETSLDKTTGIAHMTAPNWSGGGSIEYSVAYDEDYFLRSDGTTTKLLDRNSFDRNIWGYNLYYATDGTGHTAGERVKLNGGFPITFDNQGTTDFGWADYWGIWTPNPDALANGATVTRELEGEAIDYTVLRAPGKLIRVERQVLPLADMDGETFEFWDWSTGDQFLIEYTHAGTVFTKIAQRDNDWNWETLTPSEVLTINAGEWYGFWSEGLGGNLDFVGGETDMTARTQEFVSGDDTIFGGGSALTLYALTQPLRAGMTANQVNLDDVFMNDAPDVNTPYAYSFEKATRSLQYNSVDVGLLPGAEPTQGNFMWGMQSGPMSTATPASLGLSDIWEMWSLDTYYIYETGPNDWNQYSALIDGDGEPVTYDPPINFFYTHSTANDADGDSTHDGKKFMLNYGGDRNLWGIPGEDVDTDGDGSPDRWFPIVSLKDGTLVGPTGTEYVVKAVDMELFMQVSNDAIPNSLQNALTTAGNLSLPSINAWVDPTTVAMPTVTDKPKVVGGVIQ